MKILITLVSLIMISITAYSQNPTDYIPRNQYKEILKKSIEQGGCDKDGDGSKSKACGGNDCDDNDVNRYPGNTEVCDKNNKDEDCNPATVGNKDRDGDGYIDANCCNKNEQNKLNCADDCNDNNRAIIPGSQYCVGKNTIMICGKGRVRCSDCVSQPNGTGICLDK